MAQPILLEACEGVLTGRIKASNKYHGSGTAGCAEPVHLCHVHCSWHIDVSGFDGSANIHQVQLDTMPVVINHCATKIIAHVRETVSPRGVRISTLVRVRFMHDTIEEG